MSYDSFDALIQYVGSGGGAKRCAVVGAEAIHALEAVYSAAKQKLVEPILCGDKEKIHEALSSLGLPIDCFPILSCANAEQAAHQATRLVNRGEADLIMKGQIETGLLMKYLLHSETGLRTQSIVHSVAFMEIETYHKLIALTDAAILIAPTLQQKKLMIQNTVSAMKKMGWSQPKVAILTAVETVNASIPASVDAADLKELWRMGEIADCIVEGPIAFDLAISRDAAALKGYDSPVAGDADLLIYPDLNAGNIGLKTLTMTGRNKSGSVVLGLKCPVVMSSRGATMENKLRSLLLASAMVSDPTTRKNIRPIFNGCDEFILPKDAEHPGNH